MNNVSSLTILPKEVFSQILTTDVDKHNFSKVSKQAKIIAEDQSIWNESAKKIGKTNEKCDNKSYVRENIKKYIRAIQYFFPEQINKIQLNGNNVYIIKQYLDSNINSEIIINSINNKIKNEKELNLENLKALFNVHKPNSLTVQNSLHNNSLALFKLVIQSGGPVTQELLSYAALRSKIIAFKKIKTLLNTGIKPDTATLLIAEQVNPNAYKFFIKHSK